MFTGFFYLSPVSELISILMPVKNAVPYLKECLESILQQTYTNWELLAINDHSSDQSPEMLAEYAAKDPRIQTYTNTGEGIITALRLAYERSAGLLVTRMDADDTMPPNKLKRLSGALKTSGKGCLATGLVHYFSDATMGEGYKRYADWLNTLTSTSSNYEDIYQECVIPSPCWMVHREDLDKSGAFLPNRYPEDYDLCFRLYEAGITVVGVNEVLHEWRDHPVRSSRTDEHYADNRFMALKIHYFLKLEYQKDDQLLLIGAGKKGKLIARKLLEAEVKFHWVSNNPKKIGKDIYGVIVESLETLELVSPLKALVAVTGPSDKAELAIQFEALHLKKGTHYWWLG